MKHVLAAQNTPAIERFLDSPIIRELDAFFDSTPGHLFAALLILLLTYVVNKYQKRFFSRKMDKATIMKAQDPTSYAFLMHGISAIIYLVGITSAIYRVPALRELSISLFASAGVIALVAGFASQQAFANIVSGFFITVFKPFRLGDRIIYHELEGVVEDITLRHTTIRTLDNKRVVIPNRVISSDVLVNFHLGDQRICEKAFYHIAYGCDLNRVKEIIREVVRDHSEFLDVRTEEDKKAGKSDIPIAVTKLGEQGITLRVLIWTQHPDAAYDIHWDTNEKLLARFAAEGIRFAVPYREVLGGPSSPPLSG